MGCPECKKKWAQILDLINDKVALKATIAALKIELRAAQGITYNYGDSRKVEGPNGAK